MPPLALAFNARAPFAPWPRRAKVLLLRSHSRRRPASQLSEHPALPFSVEVSARALFALLSARFLARETMAPFAWNIRDLHCYSVSWVVPENTQLVRNLVRIVFAFLAPKSKTGRKWPIFIDPSGGADGTRTRDLRRDRPEV